MKKIFAAILLLCAGFSFTGCRIAALTAAGAYAYNKGDENKAAFAKVNADREAHGLPPLTWDEFMHPDKYPTPTTSSGSSTTSNTTSK